MNTKDSLIEIGNNIQIARLKKNLTQEALAEKCDVSDKYISEGITYLIAIKF